MFVVEHIKRRFRYVLCLSLWFICIRSATSIATIVEVRRLSTGKLNIDFARPSCFLQDNHCTWCFSDRALWIDYTGCHRRKGPNFGRVFLMLNYTDITQNTYIQSWTVTEIMAREKCGHLAFPRSIRLQLYREPPLPGHLTACRAYVG